MTDRSDGQDPARRAFHRARAALDVAEAILTDPHLDAQAATCHLRGAREALGLPAEEPPGRPPEEVGRSGLRAALLTQARALEEALAAEETRLFGDELRREARAMWTRRALLLLAWISPVLAYLIFVPFDYREGPWRVEFFPTADFEGESEVRRHNDVSYKWRKTGPLRDFPEDEFSGIWDTCLVLDEPRTITFRISSDDGSRLFVDGVRVLDNWGTHAERSRGADVELEPGVHHLRIRFFDARGPASLSLEASMEGERPRALPAKYLRYPGEDPDPNDVCAAVRAEPGT